ncbi:MAG: hypothetical protein MMC23_007204 [Stictis urceolatum]|nr:hypothetical protein [Stictis urceolata]
MAVTRHTTGSSRPRVFPVVETAPTTTRKTPTTVKPKTKKTTAERVTKPTTTKSTKKASVATHKRKPTVGDKVKGALKKAEGAVQRKPGKKAAGTAEMRGHDGKKVGKV